MSTYTSDNTSSYASSGVGTAGLTLGVIGTALASGILGNGGLSGLFGNSNSQSMQYALAQKDATIAQLEANAKTDAKLVEVYTTLRTNEKALEKSISDATSRILALETAAPLREQIVMDQVNAVANTANAAIASLSSSTAASIASLQATLAGITKTVVPNSAVCPGWGNVTITPSTTTSST